MNDYSPIDISEWFAIRTRQDFKAEEVLTGVCDEVFFPKTRVAVPGRKPVERALIPHVLFIRTTRTNALTLEAAGRRQPESCLPFWIYRYPKDNEIQVVSRASIHLLRLLTSDDTSECRIFTARDFREKQHVRVTGGIYKGYEGFVQRVRKNRHVVVRIEGVCMVILPFIHPDLLEPIDDDDKTV